MKPYQKERLRCLLDFFSVKNGGRLLFIMPPEGASSAQRGSAEEFLSEARSLFSERGIEIETYQVNRLQSMWDDRMYDGIILRYVLCCRRDEPMNEGKSLKLLSRHLNAGGRIFVLENNRLGMRTLAGDRYDGMDKDKGLIRQELVRAFEYAGLNYSFYYPHPFAEEMAYLFSDDRLPLRERLSLSVCEGNARLCFFDEAEAVRSAAVEGMFSSLANQFLCVAKKEPDNEQKLIYRRYDIRRDKRFCIITSIIMAGDGTRTMVRRAANDSSGKHILKIYDSFCRLEKLYQGYTLQTTPCVSDMERVALRVEDGTTLEDLLDEAIEREASEEFYGFIQRAYDILTAPTRIMTSDGSPGEHADFSSDQDFVRMFGEMYANEEALFANDRVLPLSPVNGSFSDYLVEGMKWTLKEYEWFVDFPVPFSYVLFRMLHRFFLEKPRRNLYGTLMTETLRKFGISEDMERVLLRMEGHFAGYVTGRAMTVDRVLSQCKKRGEFLPVGELVGDFLDGNGMLPATEEEKYDDIGNDFKSKLVGKLRQVFS